MTNKGFKSISLKEGLAKAIAKFVEEDQTYGSVAEFVSEAARLRLIELIQLRAKVKENAK